MLVDGFSAPVVGTNCWVIAANQGSECLVVDPGIGALGTPQPDVDEQLNQIVQRHRLRPIALLATHGHLDHTFSIRPIAEKRGLPAYIHADDRALLAHPERAFGDTFGQMFAGMNFVEPSDVRELHDGDRLELAGVALRIDHAPGHTPGSILISIESEQILLSGDVLFAGSIGRTDLPGGSLAQMAESLRQKVLTLPDDYQVLPGHGPQTTIGRERVSNPYLIAASEGSL